MLLKNPRSLFQQNLPKNQCLPNPRPHHQKVEWEHCQLQTLLFSSSLQCGYAWKWMCVTVWWAGVGDRHTGLLCCVFYFLTFYSHSQMWVWVCKSLTIGPFKVLKKAVPEEKAPVPIQKKLKPIPPKGTWQSSNCPKQYCHLRAVTMST